MQFPQRCPAGLDNAGGWPSGPATNRAIWRGLGEEGRGDESRVSAERLILGGRGHIVLTTDSRITGPQDREGRPRL